MPASMYPPTHKCVFGPGGRKSGTIVVGRTVPEGISGIPVLLFCAACARPRRKEALADINGRSMYGDRSPNGQMSISLDRALP